MKDNKARYFEGDPTEYVLDDDGRPIIPCSEAEKKIIADGKIRERGSGKR